MADGERNQRRRPTLLWVGLAAAVVVVAVAAVWAIRDSHGSAPQNDCDVVAQLGPQWTKMQQSVAALESGAGETKDLLAVADAESDMAGHIRAAQTSVTAPDLKTQLGNWAEGTALTAKGQRDAATPRASSGSLPPTSGVDNDSMRATTLVYNATAALKKACPQLQLSQTR